MMVIFLVGLVSMILMRTLRKDYARYSKEDDIDDMVRHMSCVVRKRDYCLCENKGADQEADQRLCFGYTELQFLVFLNPKFQAFGLFLRLYRPVKSGPGRKPGRPVFLHHGSYLENG